MDLPKRKLPAAVESFRSGVIHLEKARAHGLSGGVLSLLGLGVGLWGRSSMLGGIDPILAGLGIISAGGLAWIASLYHSEEASGCFSGASENWGSVKSYIAEGSLEGPMLRIGEPIVKETPNATPDRVNWSLWPWKNPFLR